MIDTLRTTGYRDTLPPGNVRIWASWLSDRPTRTKPPVSGVRAKSRPGNIPDLFINVSP